MKKRPYEGFFLTIEGGDGCGKSTLAATLGKELLREGYEVVQTREPGGTPLAEQLRVLLLHSSYNICKRAEMLLFLTARVQHIDEVILPALRAGKIVICERFNDSTVAYQACARHLGVQEVEKICELACEGLTPDITFLLDLDPELSLARVQRKKDRLEREKLQFHQEVRNGYLHLADKYAERICIIDAALSPQEVARRSLEVLQPQLPHV